MHERKFCKNTVTINGVVTSGLMLDHECKETKMYKFYIGVSRKSGSTDEIPVFISGTLLDNLGISIKLGSKYKITGEYRSFNKITHVENGIKSKVLLYVLAKDVDFYEECEETTNNRIDVEGYVVKANPVRETPNGKRIMEITLAVNRANSKSSYLPCIIWNPNKFLQDTVTVGKEVCITGRIQSREYTKKINEINSEKKIAYEVSVGKICINLEKEESK